MDGPLIQFLFGNRRAEANNTVKGDEFKDNCTIVKVYSYILFDFAC